MSKYKFLLSFLCATLVYSSASAMELKESNETKWIRRIGGSISTLIGGGILYYSIKNNLEHGTPLLNKTNLIAGSLIIGGLGSFTTKELGIARPVYHPENGPEEDKEIAQLVMSSRNLGEKITENVRGSIAISLPLLYTIIQQKPHAKKANELYYNQQKPILARLPLIGAPIDGILYNPDHWFLLNDMTKNHNDIKQLVFLTSFWVCIGAYQGIQKSLSQEKPPEDKDFEKWICTSHTNLVAQNELCKIWIFMNYKVAYNHNNPKQRDIHPIGYLPLEIITHILSYVSPDNQAKILCEDKIPHILVPTNQLIRYVVPYIGPFIHHIFPLHLRGHCCNMLAMLLKALSQCASSRTLSLLNTIHTDKIFEERIADILSFPSDMILPSLSDSDTDD